MELIQGTREPFTACEETSPHYSVFPEIQDVTLLLNKKGNNRRRRESFFDVKGNCWDKKKNWKVGKWNRENLPDSRITAEETAYISINFNCVWLFETLWIIAHQLLCPWDSPGKNTRVGFFSRGSSWPRDQTHTCCVSYVSCFGRWVLYH